MAPADGHRYDIPAMTPTARRMRRAGLPRVRTRRTVGQHHRQRRTPAPPRRAVSRSCADRAQPAAQQAHCLERLRAQARRSTTLLHPRRVPTRKSRAVKVRQVQARRIGRREAAARPGGAGRGVAGRDANAPARMRSRTGREVCGGGAENRTPVHDSPLGSISRLSHLLGFGRGYTCDERALTLAGSVFRVRHTGYVFMRQSPE